MTHVRTFVVALCFAAGAFAFGCSDEEIVVATLPPPDGDGGTKGGPAARCVDNDDCTPDAFCDRRDCGERAGHCELRPQFCETEAAPVCGCNGVTYRNNCLREIAGVAERNVGECRGR